MIRKSHYFCHKSALAASKREPAHGGCHDAKPLAIGLLVKKRIPGLVILNMQTGFDECWKHRRWGRPRFDQQGGWRLDKRNEGEENVEEHVDIWLARLRWVVEDCRMSMRVMRQRKMNVPAEKLEKMVGVGSPPDVLDMASTGRWIDGFLFSTYARSETTTHEISHSELSSLRKIRRKGFHADIVKFANVGGSLITNVLLLSICRLAEDQPRLPPIESAYVPHAGAILNTDFRLFFPCFPDERFASWKQYHADGKDGK
ncbi:hypothetical protein EDD18DRAFT_1384836 [Armillaria luteobubalina]|uniref:Uncharacterized protein n=1 Tax=Armillaria luteobubalina TaxID=153913 RepID=A0AA39UXX7_9AGAR|nr:hypothetical protein EDD18DRAFT_1384836 [Armillaria luteobubalina]